MWQLLVLEDVDAVAAERQITATERQLIKKMFRLLDKSNDGVLDWGELNRLRAPLEQGLGINKASKLMGFLDPHDAGYSLSCWYSCLFCFA